MTRAVTVQPNEDKEIIKLCISGIPKPDALNQFPKIGRGCELLKTVSTRISTFSSNTGDVLVFQN